MEAVFGLQVVEKVLIYGCSIAFLPICHFRLAVSAPTAKQPANMQVVWLVYSNVRRQPANMQVVNYFLVRNAPFRLDKMYFYRLSSRFDKITLNKLYFCSLSEGMRSAGNSESQGIRNMSNGTRLFGNNKARGFLDDLKAGDRRMEAVFGLLSASCNFFGVVAGKRLPGKMPP
ncbi:hypothetical protein ACFPPD_05870 [Cohnella suwonensis]|uniref:Uncharacterized protein n=1 Tax=Cohnella suwonensis TaxID=696072 RepID=A0ABW0LQS0_9BACL